MNDRQEMILSLGTKIMLATVMLCLLTFGLCTAVVFLHFQPAFHLWHSSGLPFSEFWNNAQNTIFSALAIAFVLFAMGLWGIGEWIIGRPLKQLRRGLEQAHVKGQPVHEMANRRDEWGILSARLNEWSRQTTELQEQARILYDISRVLGNPYEIKHALEHLLFAIVHHHHLSAAAILLYHPEEDLLHGEFFCGISQEFGRSLRVKSGEGLTGIVFASASPRWIADTALETDDVLMQELRHRQHIQSALLVPLIADGKTLGVVSFFSQQRHGLNEEHMDSLTIFGQHLAVALRNSERMGDLDRCNQQLKNEVATATYELTQMNVRLVQKVRELKTVYDLALITATSTHVEDITLHIIQRIKELVDVQGGAFFLLNNDSGYLDPIAPAFDRPFGEIEPFRCKPDQSEFLQHVVRDKQSQLSNFIEGPGLLPQTWEMLRIRSILALPLLQNDAVVGLFCVINKVNGLFSQDDIRLLSLLTNRVTEVLHRLTLNQQLHQKVNDLSILQNITNQLPNPPVLEDTLNTIGRITRQGLGEVDLCLFFLYQPENDMLMIRGGNWSRNLPEDLRKLHATVSEKRILADVFHANQPAHYGEAPVLWEKEPMMALLQLTDALLCPLTVEHNTIGVMAIGTRSSPGLSVEQCRLAGLIAEQIAVIAERARLYEKLISANSKLEQMNNLKNEFISMVSHELRTPLTTIKGFVSVVLNEETGPLNNQQRKFLETSDRAIDRLTLLVSDLLDISRIEAGQIKMQMHPTSLQELTSRIAANFGPQFKAASLSLGIEIPEGMPLVMVDPLRINQVLDNLISNALRFTTQGGVMISAEDKGDFVMVSVKDTGSGIAKAEQEKIFDKFYQIKIGSSWPSKGTGLGLAIVKSIIESHRGKVWVESELGHGADFRFLIPRARLDSPEDFPLSAPVEVVR